MSVVLKGCQGTICYIDDILVTGKTRSEHEENLRQVFQRLQQYGLRVKLSKCRFFQDEHNLTRSQANKEKGGQYTVCKESKKQDGAEVIHRLDDLQCEVPARNNQCVTPTVQLAEEECKMVMGEEVQACLQESERASQ